MLKKIYLEITNVCNLNCSFCHKTKREKKFLSKDEFLFLATKIREHTKYLYLHLMGEPLLHPELPFFLEKANELGFLTTIATNGVLIQKRQDDILKNRPYKVTFSIHSYEANHMNISLSEYLENIISFCKKAEKEGTICVLRLWNEGSDNKLNGEIIDFLKSEFSFCENRKGYTLSDKIYLEFAQRFVWPDMNETEKDVRFCMGLRDHVGVLSDGSVVPCCLDADGEITLGNLFRETLSDIINSPRAKAIYDGFSKGKCAEEMCKKCDYAQRFS